MSQSSKNQKQLRNLMVEVVEGCLQPYGDTALFFSGGIDSAVLLFCCLELGIKPVAYTFYMENNLSEDWVASKRACKKLGIELVKVICPVDINIIKKDVIKLASRYDAKTKTEFECAYPILYLAKKVREQSVLSGAGGDYFFGVSRSALLSYGVRKSKESFDRFRKESLANPRRAGEPQHTMICNDNNCDILFPYFDKRILDFFLRFNWQELNYGKSGYKQFIVDAFGDYFKKIKVRAHANMQIVAGIREIFRELLFTELNDKPVDESKDLNRVAIGFYNRLAKKYNNRSGSYSLV